MSGIFRKFAALNRSCMANQVNNPIALRSSTAEFLIFQAETESGGVEVFYRDDSIWATQKAMAALFECTPENVLMHIRNIYSDGELQKEATAKDFLVVRQEGTRQVNRELQFYNLDALISVGYAESEFEKYRIVQDRLFKSDFDRMTELPLFEKEK